jgi:GTP-binding protein
MDTPGIFDDNCDCSIAHDIESKLIAAIREAGAVFFVVDDADYDTARLLRKQNKENVVVIANKNDKNSQAQVAALELGFPIVISVSAEHGDGIFALLEHLYAMLPDEIEKTEPEENDVKLAIVGRPNVGKSTIINTIIDANKRLTADFSGTTRETCEVSFDFMGKRISLLDTPGIRRKSCVDDVLEKISIITAQKAYKDADMVILVIDGVSLKNGTIEKQDMTLASSIIENGKTLIIAINKVDLTPYSFYKATPIFLKQELNRNLSQLKNVHTVFVCGHNRSSVLSILSKAIYVLEKQDKRIKTSNLNNWLADLNKTDIMQSVRFKLKYIAQIGSSPPKFLIFATNIKNIRDSQKRFIINNLSSFFNYEGVLIRVLFKEQRTKKTTME